MLVVACLRKMDVDGFAMDSQNTLHTWGEILYVIILI